MYRTQRDFPEFSFPHIPPISIWRCKRSAARSPGMLWPAGLGMALGFSVLAAAAWRSRAVGVSPAVVKVCMLFISLHYGHVEIYNVYSNYMP